MDELRESSLLFSLEGLLETERERVQREAREVESRRKNELQRVAEAAERHRVAQAREREARARREELEQERERLEQQRSEAMKQAAIERARLEADGKLKLIELEQTQKHQLLLAKLNEGERASRYRALAGVSSAAFAAILIASLSAYFGWLRPAHAQGVRQAESALQQSVQRVAAAERALSLEREKSARLSQRVRELEAVPPPAAHAEGTPAATHNEPAARPQPNTRPAWQRRTRDGRPCGDSGDPLDDCLH